MPHLRLLKHTIFLLLISQLLAPVVQAQSPDSVEALLASMTVPEKVGQLFIVPFVGNDIGPESEIITLITTYKIGGVVLQSSNGNFHNNAETPQEIANLTNALQAHTLANKNIPLFIAVDHEGDAWPYTRITGGVTPVSSALSIGAAWNLENAYAVGTIVGRELSAMGINMLLGPVLDVLNDPRPTDKGDIGIRAFGGDPFWVGEMGKAYIRGIHESSNYTIATVAKHFPGHGGSDRLPDNEVATVDKSLRELKRIELAPFFTVTGVTPSGSAEGTENEADASITDAMMSSHIRYRGLQGDIRQFTAPISFDEQGMTTLLQLPEFITWRNNGGLIISDALGVPAVRKHYDPTLQTFPHRQIAREAFLAGNDLLILSQFDLHSIWSNQFENIKDTILFFQDKYQNDREFAARVDQSVARILRLKFKLFPNPSPNALFVDGEVALAASGKGQEVIDKIAQESLTLLYPTPDEYKRRLPRPPILNEKILIISDIRRVLECFQRDCEPFEPLGYRAIETIILEQYGPTATRQVLPENIASMSFAELKQVLVGSLAQVNQPLIEETDRPPEFRSPEEVLTLIQEADWIVFATLDLNTTRFPNADALKLFLAQGFNRLNKKLIVFALNSPYHLDTTEINKLTAYFGLYSKTGPHLEIAVRALFGEATFTGAPPITVEGISYHLPNILAPDPIRSFPLQVQRVITPSHSSAPASVIVQVGPILDHNGHRVPDGTPVQISALYGHDGRIVSAPTVHTLNGQVETTINFNDPGVVEITAKSGAAQSARPQFANLEFPPTATPSPTPTTTAISTVTPTPTSASPIAAVPSPTPQSALIDTTTPSDTVNLTPNQPVNRNDLLTALLGIFLSSTIGIFSWQRTNHTPSDRIRLILVTFIGGMVAYLLYGIGWLRPDLWLTPTAPIIVQRLTLSVLVLIFGFLGNLVEQLVNN